MRAFDRDQINALALAYYRGDEDALEPLMEQCYSLARTILRRRDYYVPDRSMDRSDMIQHAMMGVYRALQTWDPNEIAFYRCAGVVIERDLQETITYVRRVGRRPQVEAVSLDEPALIYRRGEESAPRVAFWELPDASGLGADPADLLESGDAAILWSEITAPLSLQERTVLIRCLLQGHTWSDAAAELGVTYKAVDSTITRLSRKVLKVLRRLIDDHRLSDETRIRLREIILEADSGQLRAMRRRFRRIHGAVA